MIETIIYDKPAIMRFVTPFSDVYMIIGECWILTIFNCRKICAYWVRSQLFMKSIVDMHLLTNTWLMAKHYNTQNDSASLSAFFSSMFIN